MRAQVPQQTCEQIPHPPKISCDPAVIQTQKEPTKSNNFNYLEAWVTGLKSVEKQYIMIENDIKQSIMSKTQSY